MPRRDDQTQRTAVQDRQQEAAQPEVLPVTGVAIHTDSQRGEFLATADVELAGHLHPSATSRSRRMTMT